MKQQRWFVTVGLILGGVACAGIIALVFFLLFPDLFPRPGLVVYQVKHGDIFFNHPEWMAIPDNYEEVLSRHIVLYDEDGFRLPERQSDTYQILGVGDSYTEAANVARPWTDVLAEKSGMTVRNLGYRGFGPTEEAEVIRRYGAGADIIIVGFFEGNDLSNVMADELREMPDEIKPEDRVLKYINWDDYPDREPRYPMQVTLGGVDQDIAFFEWYVWWLNGEPEAYRESENVKRLVQSWEAMRAAAGGQCLILTYFPSKEHLYVPYLTAESQARLMQKSHVIEGDTLDNTPSENTFDELLSRLDNMRNVIQEEAQTRGYLFFDTTPVLQAAVARGEQIAYVYDTHWNQHGHDLVGEALAQYLATNPCGG